MYYYEKDYIMRLIHGIARILARMLFNRELDEAGGYAMVMEEAERENDDYLRQMVDDGKVNEAEEKLFDLIASTSWEDKQKAALVLSFYDYLNGKDDEFLAAADFSREEIITGLEDGMKAVGMEIPAMLIFHGQDIRSRCLRMLSIICCRCRIFVTIGLWMPAIG